MYEVCLCVFHKFCLRLFCLCHGCIKSNWSFFFSMYFVWILPVGLSMFYLWSLEKPAKINWKELRFTDSPLYCHWCLYFSLFIVYLTQPLLLGVGRDATNTSHPLKGVKKMYLTMWLGAVLKLKGFLLAVSYYEVSRKYILSFSVILLSNRHINKLAPKQNLIGGCNEDKGLSSNHLKRPACYYH